MGTLYQVDGATGLVHFHKNGTEQFVLEQGTSFPASPVTGQIFYRTDLVQFYAYDGTNWRTQAGGSLRIYNETPSGTVGSGNTVFTTSTAYISGSTVVTRDGLVMKPGGVDYTETTPSSGTITFITAPASSSTILVSYSRTIGQDVQQLIKTAYTVGTPSSPYTGSTTVFDLPFTYTLGVGSLLAYSGGVLMLAGTDYTETNTSRVTFGTARTTGEIMQFIKVGISADYGNSITLNSGTTNQLARYSSSTNIVGTSSLTDTGSALTSTVPLAMGSNKITGLAAPASTGDALSQGNAASVTTLTLSSTVNSNINFDNYATHGISGTQTNDSASAGNVGQYIESVVANVTWGTSLNISDVTSISLTAGDWDVAIVADLSSGTVAPTSVYMGISTTSGNSGTGLIAGSNKVRCFEPSLIRNSGGCIPSYRMSLASTTTVYFKVEANYTGTAGTTDGRLSARRVR